MSSRSVLIFSIITAIVVIVASFSITSRYQIESSGISEKAVFGGLIEKIGDVETIIIRDKDQSITVNKKQNDWVMADRNDYQVSPEAVRNILLGLAELRLKEPKTERAKLYSRLEVEDVTEPNAKSRLVKLQKNGNTLAELIVGKETSEIAGASDVGRYVRKPGETRSWLAEGRLILPATIKAWVSPQFLNIAKKRVKKITVLHPDGNIMNVIRVNESDKKLRVEDLPIGREIEYQSDVDNMADGLDELELEDVRRAGELKFPENQTIKTTYNMFDGLIVEVEMFEDKENRFWGRFKAITSSTIEPEIIKEASIINATLSKWIYELPAYKFRYMSRKIEDVLKQPKSSDSK